MMERSYARPSTLKAASRYRPEPAPLEAGLGPAIERARRRLRALQHEDGHWCAELEGDSILESEYFLLMHFLGRSGEPKVLKAAAYLRDRQLEEGGWAAYPGGPAEISASVKAYFVLKLAGDDPEAPHMKRARAAALGLGGLEACNSFTKLYLSIFGQYEWRKSPAVPPELILFPSWFPFNIYEMSAWSRAIVVPLSIIWARKPSCAVPRHASLAELRTGSPARPSAIGAGGIRSPWSYWFLAVDRIHKVMERFGLLPLRRLALQRCEEWILQRLAASDGLGAIFPPIVNTIIALRCLGYPVDHPTVASQVRELEALEIEEVDSLRIQPCKSPVWDTALSIYALAEEATGEDRPALARAVRWILDKEVRRPGDWRVKNPHGPVGGWYFEYANEFYPDVDDTAQVISALSKLTSSGEPGRGEIEGAVRRGLDWLLSMQNRDGGWASFDRACDREYLTHVPFADHNAMIDPSTTDVTSRALEALLRTGFDPKSREVRRAVDFVLGMQEEDGSWYGRWGCNYLYGTWLALTSLQTVGGPGVPEAMRLGADWLREVQNEDGGWGELPVSYDDPALKGQGPSTAAQTAWALLGLVAAGEAGSESVRRGVEYLLATQEETGGWSDEAWTGTGFPKVFYLRYHLYATYFPLLALIRCGSEMRTSSFVAENPSGPRPLP